MRMTVGTPAVPTLKNFAPNTWAEAAGFLILREMRF